MVHQDAERLRVDAQKLRRQLQVKRADEVLQQKRDVLPPFPQGSHGDMDHVQAVEEVFPEPPALDVLYQIPIGAGDDPRVDQDRLGAAHGPDDFLFDHPQELHLHVERQVADFVQVDGAAIGRSEQPRTGLHRGREGPPDVPEQLALEQRLRNRPAVDRNECLRVSRAGRVDGAGDNLLACSALSRDEDVAGRRADLGDLRPHAAHGRALPQQALFRHRGFDGEARHAHKDLSDGSASSQTRFSVLEGKGKSAIVTEAVVRRTSLRAASASAKVAFVRLFRL